MAKANNKYQRVNKTKEMEQVFKRKSGAHERRKSRTREEQEWRREWEEYCESLVEECKE